MPYDCPVWNNDYFRYSPLVGVSVAPHPDDFFTWHGNVLGPEGTPYAGGIFHFVVEFPQDYPKYVIQSIFNNWRTLGPTELSILVFSSPPTVTIKTRIEHPCVVGDQLQICFLDGCLEFVSSWMDRYSAWSPGFSAFSVVLQIHGMAVVVCKRGVLWWLSCLCLAAFLYDGTAEVALQNLSELSEYVRKRQEWESAVQWSVEQVGVFVCVCAIGWMWCIVYWLNGFCVVTPVQWPRIKTQG